MPFFKSGSDDPGELYEQFYSDPRSAFPSNDKLIYIFLEDFQNKHG